MKHTTKSSFSISQNCYSTEITNKGIINSYSICIGNKPVDPNYIMSLRRYLQSARTIEGRNFYDVRLIDKEVTFKKVPYKQTRKVEYTQRFRFLLISIYTPFDEVYNMKDLYQRDRNEIKSFVHYNCLVIR